MRRARSAAIGMLAGTALFAAAAGAQTCPVPQDLWQSPRSGAVILAQPSIRQCVRSWLAKPGDRLLIHYGMGDEAQLRAAELRYWLIALALDGKRIKLAGDLAAGQTMNIEVKGGK